MRGLKVIACGPMTSLQDGGRVGHARFGVSRSGAMDRMALACANTLVGNPPGTAAIELMLMGATLRADGGDLRLALAGAPMAAACDGQSIPPGTSFRLHAGATVTIAPASAGVFGYLAIAGGFEVPESLGSRSLQPRAGLGGFGGRALRPDDLLPVRLVAGDVVSDARLDLALPEPEAPIRVVLGPQDDHFARDQVESFLRTAYMVSAEADRMGYRLAGPPIAHARGFNIVSDGIVAGSVQVPGSGVPIVMMSDHQTTGGYPKIATVASVDLGRLAQRRPGESVRFTAIPVGEAEELARERARLVADLPRRLRPLTRTAPGTAELLGLNLAGDAVNALDA